MTLFDTTTLCCRLDQLKSETKRTDEREVLFLPGTKFSRFLKDQSKLRAYLVNLPTGNNLYLCTVY
jgi:hypothetical protein